MSRRNAPLTPTGRLRLARCVVEDGGQRVAVDGPPLGTAFSLHDVAVFWSGPAWRAGTSWTSPRTPS
ncbi:hypothetical protein [Streptomyces sp. NPDC086766]|uniref:hypothetical protein n=1 Tax=Streptomyces sp. NPDC086766 TaxID=3365754 RepID=UPI0037F126AD